MSNVMWVCPIKRISCKNYSVILSKYLFQIVIHLIYDQAVDKL